ncbi:MAG: hypothetical protein ABGY75_20645 [Gemmataceae bacterium]
MFAFARRLVPVVAVFALAAGRGHAQTQAAPIQSLMPPQIAPEVQPPAGEPGSPAQAKELPADLKKLVDDYLKERDTKKKTDDEQKQKELMEKALTTGTKFPLSSYWDNGLWFAPPNKDWRFHFAGRVQFEPESMGPWDFNDPGAS